MESRSGGPSLGPHLPHRADPPGDHLPQVTKGTNEERIVELHHHKRDLAELLELLPRPMGRAGSEPILQS